VAHEDFIEKIQKTKQVKNHRALPVEIHNYIFKCLMEKREKEKLEKRTMSLNSTSFLGLYNTMSLQEALIS